MTGASLAGLSASYVVVGDGASPPIADGALLFDADGVLVAVGPRSELAAAHPDAKFQHHEAVLLPGLVNAHCHLELSALRGRCPGGRGFGPWVTELIAAREQSPPESDYEAIDAGVGELLRAGTVAVGEVSNSLASVPALATAPLLGRVFHEVFGMRSDTGEVVLQMAQQARADMPAWPRNLSYTLSPHTPFSMHPDLMRAVLAEGRANGARMSLHLAEHAAERAFLRDGGGPFKTFLDSRHASQPDWDPPGLDPVTYAEQLGALAPDVIAVHVADARPEEIARLAERKVPVVLCPRSNLHIEVRLPPLVELLGAGIRPGLGTDSLASCPNLDVLEEARALRKRFSAVPPRTLLAMATGWGAEALGLSQHVGTFTPGCSPGVVAFPHAGPAPADPEAFVLDQHRVERQVLAFAGLPEELSP